MCQHRLCLDLMDSLSAAFQGMDGRGDLIGSWGWEVMEALQYSRLKSPCPHALLYRIALDLLEGIIGQCPCEGLAEAILHDPQRFFRAVEALASECFLAQIPAADKLLH